MQLILNHRPRLGDAQSQREQNSTLPKNLETLENLSPSQLSYRHITRCHELNLVRFSADRPKETPVDGHLIGQLRATQLANLKRFLRATAPQII